jgi:hypothetical protein
VGDTGASCDEVPCQWAILGVFMNESLIRFGTTSSATGAGDGSQARRAAVLGRAAYTAALCYLGDVVGRRAAEI